MRLDGLVFRRGGPEDAAGLAAFGAATFEQTFGAENAPDDLAAYLSAAYGQRQQHAELVDPGIVTLIVTEGADIVAFAQVRRSARPACVGDATAAELWRFYVHRRWHGSGASQELMRMAEAAARELGGSSLWLSVWERNPRAIAFYRKCGFVDVGSKPFVVGRDEQTDRVMVKQVTPAMRRRGT